MKSLSVSDNSSFHNCSIFILLSTFLSDQFLLLFILFIVISLLFFWLPPTSINTFVSQRQISDDRKVCFCRLLLKFSQTVTCLKVNRRETALLDADRREVVQQYVDLKKKKKKKKKKKQSKAICLFIFGPRWNPNPTTSCVLLSGLIE